VHRFLLNIEQAQERNPKGELQEYLQAVGAELPVYKSEKEGKDNAPTFACKVTAQGKSATGTGKSKRQAEQAAAAALLAQFRQ
jgi:ribonuclease-3